MSVEKLLLNFKTLEEFKRFKRHGMQELSMIEDLQSDMVENKSDSPFYGIYYGDTLIARMCLYTVEAKYDNLFSPPQNGLEISKLEVLKDYQHKGYGRMLVEFAKSFQMPIRTLPRINSTDFWNSMGFESTVNNEVEYFTWAPNNVTNQSITIQ
ncbi:GNAT family N-acetyltransferase [Bacillus solimangrovi]|uniref:GNAT family N-acetyltransferase n=2 Tax=Bacillus solimangrovi TaxID=1305675 RepID=A0A1E5LIQ2_9BACI|nr:GNAT family N-acetyltransferase [Bacillus solimangrovi]